MDCKAKLGSCRNDFVDCKQKLAATETKDLLCSNEVKHKYYGTKDCRDVTWMIAFAEHKMSLYLRNVFEGMTYILLPYDGIHTYSKT